MEESMFFGMVHHSLTEEFAETYIQIAFDKDNVVHLVDPWYARGFGYEWLYSFSHQQRIMPHWKQKFVIDAMQPSKEGLHINMQ